MTDKEKVIRGLECLSNPGYESLDDRFCDTCPYDSASCGLDVLIDARALLKAQEPRVMTFDEIEDTIACSAVWYEAFLTRIVDFISGRHKVTKKTYGDAWRCWSARPTDEQREAEPWQ